jgi:Caspase domain
MKRRQFIQTTIQASTATLLMNAIVPHPSTAASSPPSRQRALLVGVNDYTYANKNTRSLYGCVNDVALLKNLLIYRYGFAPQDIITLTDKQATREAILTNFEQHLLTAQPNDTVVFAFSGHGTRLNDPKEKFITTALMPYDHAVQVNGEDNYITGKTLFLLRSALKTDNVTVILDCCYAGGGTRGDSTGRSTPAPFNAKTSKTERQYQANLIRQLKLDPTELNQYRETQQGTKGVLLAAANVGQTASDATFGAKYKAGAFTKFLTQTLWENPTLPLNALQDAVTLALIGFDGKDAQTPEFSYPPDRAGRLKSRSAFVTLTPISSIPAQGTVLSVDPTTRQVSLWLGGLAPGSLDLEPDAQFRCFTNQSSRKSHPIATLKAIISDDFTAIATIPRDQTLPKPGALLQQHYRPVPKQLNLRVGLDSSLNATTALFQPESRLQPIPPNADGRFEGVDVILSQMTADYHKLTKTAIPIGRYGLFSSKLQIIPGSFGDAGETVEQAVDRLDPAFKAALIKKLLSGMSVTTQELAETEGITASVHIKGQPEAIMALPSQLKEPAQLSQTLEITLKNATKQNLQSLLIIMSSNGKFSINPITNGNLSEDLTFQKQDINTNIEILILISPKSLVEMSEWLKNLLNPSQQPPKQDSRSISNDQVDSVFKTLYEGSGSRTTGITPFVISLPIRVAPKP